jgi:hypothetical protein
MDTVQTVERSTVNGPMLSQAGSMSGTATRFTLSSRPVGPSPPSCETLVSPA